jgi:hypothetical protein
VEVATYSDGPRRVVILPLFAAGLLLPARLAVSQPIASGAVSMDFDPIIFGNISQVAVFSATGDAVGYANVSAERVDAHFSSASAGIGRLAALR